MNQARVLLNCLLISLHFFPLTCGMLSARPWAAQ
jgi:hypothetical protein